MALICCPNCNHEISDLSEKCVHCGYVINNNNSNLDGTKKSKCKRSVPLIVLAIICFVFSGIMLFRGIDKMSFYSNTGSFFDRNAYVGGDAYNYIINGTYSTSFFVLSAGFFISGMICVASNEIIIRIPE